MAHPVEVATRDVEEGPYVQLSDELGEDGTDVGRLGEG